MTLHINEFRNQKHMSIRALAEKSGVAVSYIEELDAGRGNPTVDIMCKLAAALEVDVDELFEC